MMLREATHRILHYEPADRMPVVHFGFWDETLAKWAAEGHITDEEARGRAEGNLVESTIARRLGFDFNWTTVFGPANDLFPGFTREVVAQFPDGTRHVRNPEGVLVLETPGAGSIPAEVEHLLTDRASWEKHYRWRLVWSPGRVTTRMVRAGDRLLRWDDGGLEALRSDERAEPYGLYCGSMYGAFRNILGLVGSSYLLQDDEALFDEILATLGDLAYRNVEYVLASGARFDFAHFWEDIAFRNGPLVSPKILADKIGGHYRRITDLLARYGVDIVSVDCDGRMEALIPMWLENGVNTVFPIEVGTWGGSIGPLRERHGRALRGVGGVNKAVFTRDRAAVDSEIERLKPLVALGGYIPCPDHNITPDAEWDLVRYYTDRMRETFGG